MRAGNLGFPLVSDRCFSQASQAQFVPEFAAPAPFSYWFFTPDSWSPFNQHFSPHLSKVSYPHLHFPCKQWLHIGFIWLVTSRAFHHSHFQFFPTATTTALPLVSHLTPLLANSAFSFTVLPWDNPSLWRAAWKEPVYPSIQKPQS